MRHVDPAASDGDFERALLESARDDGPPADATAAAWAKFVSVSGGVASGVGADALRPPRTEGNSWFGSAPAAPLKWLVLGALGGSVLTAAWLKLSSARHPDAELSTLSAQVASPALTGVATPAPSTPRSAPAPASAATTEESALRAALPGKAGLRRGRSARAAIAIPKPDATGSPRISEEPDATTKASSRLAAEVAALDAVRTALSIGAPERALQGVEGYRREFPEGELTPEAHVLEVEALAAKGDRAGARRESERFLARYPKDPHVTRVRWLGEQ